MMDEAYIALHKCYALTGAEAGDIDDFRALVDRETITVAAVKEMREERDNFEAEAMAARVRIDTGGSSIEVRNTYWEARAANEGRE
jgi:hypothetical protein